MTTCLVISDTHLGDGDPDIEPWRDGAQSAFETMLRAAAPGGELADGAVELICNGDSFDFLLARPELGRASATDVNTAHAKWSGIVAAHTPWFAALRDFLRAPGRRVTFLIGNHDVELFYPSIRARVRSAINAPPGTVRFCLTRAYRPLPDVVVEHGCQYDPWNAIPHLWEARVAPATPDALEMRDGQPSAVGALSLPWGTRYYNHAFAPIKRRFPYLDTMVPDMESAKQYALLALLAPELLTATAPRMAELLPSAAVAAAIAEPTSPRAYFALALRTGDATTRAVGGAPAAGGGSLAQIQALYAALEEPPAAALRAVITAVAARAAEAPEMAHAATIFAGDDPPRYALFGHTHLLGRWNAPGGQTILNTGAWVRRRAVPKPEAWSADLAAWFERPHDRPYPGADASRYTAAWLRADPGAATTAELIAWRDHGFVAIPDEPTEA